MSIVIALALLVILAALAAAGFFMLRGGGNTSQQEDDTNARNKHMAKALAVRIAVSVVLFICILIAWKLGYLKPAGIPVTVKTSPLVTH
jgi:archaellum biogenesis protein FlaJ (TadC family)